MVSRALRCFSALAFATSCLAAGFAAAQAPALKIVVLAGEDAVNVIQQKTAVQPLVEIRDRNNLPVSGAVVTFTVGGGQHAAFAGGLQTLTVTTNAAGQAAAAGISPLTTGAFQIQVQAAFQGQVATAAISQTNFATAAAAAAAGNTSGAASGAGAASGGGGGISGTTIGIIGAAVGGGALVAANAGGEPEATSPTSTAPPATTPAPISKTLAGPLSGQFDFRQTTGNSTCVSTRAIAATLTMTIGQLADGSVSGSAFTTGNQSEVSFTASPFCSAVGTTPFNWNAPVTGTASSLSFSGQSANTGPTEGGSVTITTTTRFTGSLVNGVVSGEFTYTMASQGTNSVPGSSAVISGSGAVTMPVTLR